MPIRTMGGRTKWMKKAKFCQQMLSRAKEGYQCMTGRIELPLRTAKQYLGFDRFESDDFAPFELPTPEARLKKRRSDLRNGLTDRQRLFLFGKLGGLNDKDAALAAGYSLSVAENTSNGSGSQGFVRSLSGWPRSFVRRFHQDLSHEAVRPEPHTFAAQSS